MPRADSPSEVMTPPNFSQYAGFPSTTSSKSPLARNPPKPDPGCTVGVDVASGLVGFAVAPAPLGGVGVFVDVGSFVGEGVLVPVGVFVGVGVRVEVGVLVGLPLPPPAVADGCDVAPGSSVGVGVAVSAVSGVGVEVLVGEGIGVG